MLMAFTIVSVWALLEPWRGREDQTSISPLLPPLLPPLQAANATMATAASTPTLRIFMHMLLLDRSSRGSTRRDRRSWPQPRPDPEMRRPPSTLAAAPQADGALPGRRSRASDGA